jgi:hypothetical protein
MPPKATRPVGKCLPPKGKQIRACQPRWVRSVAFSANCSPTGKQVANYSPSGQGTLAGLRTPVGTNVASLRESSTLRIEAIKRRHVVIMGGKKMDLTNIVLTWSIIPVNDLECCSF